MTLSWISVLKSAAVVLAARAAAHTIDESDFSPADIIVRDVVVLGGGATGSYAAVRLKDSGKTVVVVEQKNRLGGHVDTYTDPGTGTPIDFGVIAYVDLPGVKDFFARFNVPIEAMPQVPLDTRYIDFTTGQPVANYATDQTAIFTALATYAQLSAAYVNQTFPGYFNFPDEVPEDLALPFGDFLAKYNLQDAVPFLRGFLLAIGDMLSVPTLFALQNFNAIHLNAIQQPAGFFVPSSRNNSELYAAVQQYLLPDLLLGSTVSVADRTDAGGVTLVVNTPSGRKLVKAKKLLVTAAPTVDNLKKLGLDTVETNVFGKWEYSSDYVGVVANAGLPDGLDILNTSPDSSPGSLNLPKLPFVSEIKYSGVPGLYTTTVVGPPGLNEHRAKIMVRDAVNKIGAAGTLPTKHLDFAAFSSHSPLQLRVSAEELKAGFIKKLYALQGRRSTFYTGAAFASDLTSILWVFTETGILPQILAAV
ncbi:FAD dependent oxidoreductase [Coniochaeta sp. 2T2.1]|nr:FAD dependent oxidoreductase [Coniochaeta sp. 2T2.1]